MIDTNKCHSDPRFDNNERERLSKECSVTIFLASTWALFRGEGRQRGECHNSYGLRPGGVEYWASTLACHFRGSVP